MRFRVRLLLCAVALALAVTAKQYFPQKASSVRAVLFGTGEDPVSQACIAFRDSVGKGEDLRESIFAFCAELYEKD